MYGSKQKSGTRFRFFSFSGSHKRQKQKKIPILRKAEKAKEGENELKTLKEKRKENEKIINCFYEKAAEMLAEAKTPEDIQEAYEYIRKERKRIAKNV